MTVSRPQQSPASVAWTLTPEQLVAACEAAQIAALPYSRHVREESEPEPHVLSAGRRSLVAARLAIAKPDGGVVLEPLLFSCLMALMGDGHDAFGSLSLPSGERWAFTVTGGTAVALAERDDGADLLRAPARDLVARLRGLIETSLAAGDALADGSRAAAPSDLIAADESGTRRAVLETRRWRSLAEGGRVRRSDAPVVARAAAAAQAIGVWEAGRIELVPGGGFTGELLGWTFDGLGGLVIEPDVEGADESGDAVVIREDPALGQLLRALWQPLLILGAPDADQARV